MSTVATIQTGSVSLSWDHAITEKMIPGLERGLTAAAMRVAEQARTSLGRDHGGTRSLPGMPPNSQKGHLSRSLVALSPSQNGTPLKAVAGTNLVYAPVLEKGKVIRAKGKLLVIPLNRAAQRLMVEVGNIGRRALLAMRFRYGGGRVARIKTKQGGILVGITPKGKTAKKNAHGLMDSMPIFLLSPKAAIKPHPFLRPAFNAVAQSLPIVIGMTASREWRAKGLVQ